MSRTESAFSKEGPKRRRLQFSLRTMLLAVTAVAVALGWQVNRAKRQQRAVEAIEAFGGTVGYDYQVSGDVKVARQKTGGVSVRGLQRDAGATSRVPPSLRNLLGDDLFSTVTWVRMSTVTWQRMTGPSISDKELAHLAEFPRLRYLDLSGTSVTDDSLKHLAGLTELEELDLTSTPVSDNGLIHLSKLTKLRRLTLHKTRATSAGLRHLAGLRRLRALELSSTWTGEGAYEDAVRELQELLAFDPSFFKHPLPEHGGLLHLKQLKDLEFLDVTYTRVTAAEVKELRKALPNLVIRHPGELITQTQTPNVKQILEGLDIRKVLEGTNDLERYDPGMLFDAWQRRRQGPNAPGAR